MCSSEEKEARKYLKERNKIRAVISNPEVMFESTSIPTTILFFDNSNEISFINCKDFVTEEERKQKGEDHTKNRVYTKVLKTYSDEQIKTILTCIKEKKDIENFSKCIKNSEIQDEIWLPNTYIDIKIEPSESRSYKDLIH